jgi:hypothetical protein
MIFIILGAILGFVFPLFFFSDDWKITLAIGSVWSVGGAVTGLGISITASILHCGVFICQM